MNIDISLYRVFCIVARNKNISKAAEELFVSQSAVTQSIKKLENEIGDILFIRKKNGVELTESGRTLFDYLNENIEKIENAENVFSRYLTLEKGSLRIGGGSALMTSIILPPVMEFCKKYPKINIVLANGKTDELLDAMNLGKIDIVVHFLPLKNMKKNFKTVSLMDTSYCLFCSKKYYKEKPIKNLNDLKNHRIIMPRKSTNKHMIFENFLKEYDYDKENTFEVSGTELQNKLALDGFGIVFSNMALIEEIKDEIKIIKEFDNKGDTIGVSSLSKDKMNIVAKEFLKYLISYYKK